jgi:hypothetical protein
MCLYHGIFILAICQNSKRANVSVRVFLYEPSWSRKMETIWETIWEFFWSQFSIKKIKFKPHLYLIGKLFSKKIDLFLRWAYPQIILNKNDLNISRFKYCQRNTLPHVIRFKSNFEENKFFPILFFYINSFHLSSNFYLTFLSLHSIPHIQLLPDIFSPPPPPPYHTQPHPTPPPLAPPTAPVLHPDITCK